MIRHHVTALARCPHNFRVIIFCPMEPFEGCWQRIRRADAHRVSFTHRWAVFTEPRTYSVVINQDDDRTGGVVRVVRREPYDVTEFALYIGEMLYQLRAALDGAVYDAAIVVSGINPPPDADKLQLPIGKDPTDFGRLASRHLRPLTTELRNYIASIQPYNARSDEDALNIHLGILNDWARKDRHRRLHVVGTVAYPWTDVTIDPPGIITSQVAHRPNIMEGEEILITFGAQNWANGINVHFDSDFIFDIAMDEEPKDRVVGIRLELLLKQLIFCAQNIVAGLKTTATAGPGLEKRS